MHTSNLIVHKSVVDCSREAMSQLSLSTLRRTVTDSWLTTCEDITSKAINIIEHMLIKTMHRAAWYEDSRMKAWDR